LKRGACITVFNLVVDQLGALLECLLFAKEGFSLRDKGPKVGEIDFDH
jgi:hypothetical protein